MHGKIKGAVGLAFLLLAGCGESGPAGDVIAPEQGTVNIQLTDGPMLLHEVSRVDVFAVRVELHRKVQDSAKHDTTRTPEWLTVSEPKALVNLLDLQNGTTLALGSVKVPIGVYKAIRLVIDPKQSSVTLKDGTVLTHSSTPGISFPDTNHMGLVVKLEEPIRVTTDTTTIVLDFDVGRSFLVVNGDFKKHGLKFNAFIHGVIKDKTGSIRGIVRSDSANGPKVAKAVVQLLKAGTALGDTTASNIVRNTQVGEHGIFEFAFIPPGQYVIRAIPHPETGYLSVLSAEFSVKAGERVDKDKLTLVVKKP